ncbi:hypothetical protein [Caldisphaera sp.]|uniref:hypothetical protein n=1 Tax=Caldisphaera sp. TaxID=2060322 RepID=UPI0025BD005D|nr:hypothetical protein [Caldisphaera sp.]
MSCMPRKKVKSNTESKEENNKIHENKKKLQKKAKLSDEEFNNFVSNISNEIIDRFGLDLINLTSDDIKDLVEEIITSIVESRVTKPTEESLMKKFINLKDQFMKAIAGRLIERDEINSRDRIEFLIAYAPELAAKSAPRLYKIAKKINASDLIDNLRQLYNAYGNPTPIRCPVCGFNSVIQDMTCIVCGAVLDEKDIKKDINLKEQLLKLRKIYNDRLIEEIVSSGYIIYDGEIKPPSLQEKDKISVKLHLNKEEREILLNLLRDNA